MSATNDPWTKEPPTTPGDYAWRYDSRSSHGLVQVTSQRGGGLWCRSTLEDGGCTPIERGGEWRRLVFADEHVPKGEIEAAWVEAHVCHPVTGYIGWTESRAKRVMEGRE